MDLEAVMPDAATVARVQAAIADYNAERPRVERDLWIRVAGLYGVWALVCGTIFLLVVQSGSRQVGVVILTAALLCVFFIWNIASAPKREFQQSLRYRLLPQILGFIENLRYRPGLEPNFMSRLPGNQLVPRNHGVYHDLLTGRFDGLEFELSELQLQMGSGNDKHVTFKGVILHFQRETSFPGQLLATAKVNALQRFVRDNFESGGLSVITADKDSIDERYEFLTDSRSAATVLVRGDITKALEFLDRQWLDGLSRLALDRKDCYLLVPRKRALLDLPGIDEALDYRRHVAPMIQQVLVLLLAASLVSKIGAAEAETD